MITLLSKLAHLPSLHDPTLKVVIMPVQLLPNLSLANSVYSKLAIDGNNSSQRSLLCFPECSANLLAAPHTLHSDRGRELRLATHLVLQLDHLADDGLLIQDQLEDHLHHVANPVLELTILLAQKISLRLYLPVCSHLGKVLVKFAHGQRDALAKLASPVAALLTLLLVCKSSQPSCFNFC